MCVFVCVHTDLDKRYFWPEDKVVALSSKSRVRFVLEYEHNVSCKGYSMAEFNMHYRNDKLTLHMRRALRASRSDCSFNVQHPT